MEQPSETAVRAGAWACWLGCSDLAPRRRCSASMPVAKNGIDHVIVEYNSRQVNA
jgi:hypothetical protein